MDNSKNTIRHRIYFYALKILPELFLSNEAWDELTCSWFIQTMGMKAWTHFLVLKIFKISPIWRAL